MTATRRLCAGDAGCRLSASLRSSPLPPSAHGAADFIDARLAVLLAYLAFASLQGPRGAAAKGWTAALAVALVAARVGLAAPHWAEYDGWADDFRDAIRAVRRARACSPSRRRRGAVPLSTRQTSIAG